MQVVGGKVQTVDPTIKDMAVQLAGKFYEDNRSTGFRLAFPTVEDYLQGRWHKADGRVVRYVPGWQHHLKLAVQVLAGMLRQPDARVSLTMKDRIAEALIANNGKAQQYAKKITQRKERGDGEDQRRLEVGAKSTGFSGSGAANRTKH